MSANNDDHTAAMIDSMQSDESNHVEWHGNVGATGVALLSGDNGETVPQPDAMLWLFAGRRVRIRIDDMGPAPAAAEGSEPK